MATISGTYNDGTNRPLEEIIEQYNGSIEGQQGTAAQKVAEDQATKGKLKSTQIDQDIADKKVIPTDNVDEIKKRQDAEYEASRTSGNYKSKYKDRPKKDKSTRKWRNVVMEEVDKSNTETNEKPDYNETARETAKANGLSKYINKDGTVDFDKLEKSKTGWKILQSLGNGLAAFGSGITGHNFDASNGFANQELNRRNEIQETYKNSRNKKLDDTRDMNTFKEKEGFKHEQNKEMESLRHTYDIDSMAKQFEWSTDQKEEIAQFLDTLQREGMDKDLENYSNMTPAQQREWRERFAGQLPAAQQFLNALAGSAGNHVGTISDEGCKKFASRSVFK